MTKLDRERLFGEMARAYARADGIALQGEDAALPPPPPAPRLDARVRGIMRRRAWARWVPGVAAVAAGLLLAVFLGTPEFWLPSAAPESGMAAPDAPPYAEPSTDTVPAPGEGTVIPLGFLLPENLTISAVDTDRGQTIYHLKDALHDDVVLTLEQAQPQQDFSALRAVSLGGGTVYIRVEDGYRLLTFEQDGIRYAMTCQYELDTLFALAEKIHV